MNRRLIHYSSTPLSEVHSVPQGEHHLGAGVYKPNGLWVSCEGDDDWLQWCHAQNFGLARLVHATEIVLHEKSNILRISTAAGIDQFEKEYLRPWLPLEPDKFLTKPSWENVAKKYQGIIISPYIYARRFGEMWYYGWDCASGCIWDASCVKEIVPLEVKRQDAA